MKRVTQPHRQFAIVATTVAMCGLSSCNDDSSRDKPTPTAPVVESTSSPATSSSTPGDATTAGEEVPGKPATLFEAAHAALGDQWRPVGPGGGGHQRYPVISPHDPRLMFVACDMSGFYRSDDSGQNWRMLDQVSATTHPPLFHPTDPNVMYVCTKHTKYGQMAIHTGWRLWSSNDRGESWTQVYAHNDERYSQNRVSAMVLDPNNPQRMWLSFALGGEVMTSHDGGVSWESVGEPSPALKAGTARLILGRNTGGSQTLFTHSGERIFRSADEGATWSDITQADRPVVDLIGKTTGSGDEQTTILYALGTPVGTGPDTAGAIRRSTDDGATWDDLTPQFMQAADSEGRIVRMMRVETSLADPKTVYVSAETRNSRDQWLHGIFKSTDGGDSWEFLFPQHEMHDVFRVQRAHAQFDHFNPGWVPLEFSWFWGGTAMYLGVSQSDPGRLLWTDMGRTIGTQDGGITWNSLYCNRGELEYYGSRGLEVTGAYRVVWDPHHDGRMWIAYNDIGNWRSDDGGLTWRYAMRGANHRLCMYELIADPDIPNRLYGASANVHDMPRWRYIARDPAGYKGGFVTSDDGGLTWTTRGEGLPEAACTALAMDPNSDPDNRTLYVVAFGHGVYKSVDSGRTWERRVSGMESYLDINENLFSLSLASDGTLYAAITKRVRLTPGQRADSRGGALFKSDDGAETWQRIGPQMHEQPSRAKNEFAFIWDVVASPHDPQEVIVACSLDLHSRTNAPGGLYRSRDHGATWQRIFPNPRCCRVDYHPTDPNVLFCGAGDGLHWSLDGGATWQLAEGIPFRSEVTRACVDPHDPNRVWAITWGGGVWTGKFRK